MENESISQNNDNTETIAINISDLKDEKYKNLNCYQITKKIF